jgi:hypothetical protein
MKLLLAKVVVSQRGSGWSVWCNSCGTEEYAVLEADARRHAAKHRRACPDETRDFVSMEAKP